MRRKLLAALTQRLLNEKGKRMTFITTLYVLLAASRNMEPDLEKLRDEFNPSWDIRALGLPAEVSKTLWTERALERLAQLPLNKVKRYIRFISPCCLRYGLCDKSPYDLDADVERVLGLIN